MANQTFAVNEKSSALLTITLTDEAGGVPGSISTIVATLYDVVSGGIINNRSSQSINGTNGGVYTAGTGVLVLTLAPADNAIMGPAAPEGTEIHRLLIVWTYGGTKQGTTEIDLVVKNMANLI